MLPMWTLPVTMVAIIAFIVWRQILQDRRYTERENFEQTALAKAKAVGLIIRRNTFLGVLAICAEEDFCSAYQLYCDEVEKGKRKATDKVVINASPTFTFWYKAEAQTMMHVGVDSEGEEFINSLIKRITGVTKYEVNAMTWHSILDSLVATDSRLFVPFAGGMPDLEWQVKFYGRKSLDEFHQHLLKKVEQREFEISK